MSVAQIITFVASGIAIVASIAAVVISANIPK